MKIEFLAAKVWRLANESLFRNSIFLMANTAALAIFGFGFWVLAAKYYSADAVGTVSSVITASALLASIAFVGFDYALIKFIPNSAEAEARTHTGLNVSALLASAVGIAYILIIPAFVPKMDLLVRSPWMSLGFILLALMTVWNSLTNSVFIAHRMTQFAFIASIIFGVMRLVLLVEFKDNASSGLIISQSLAMLICVAVSFIFLRRSINYRYKTRISRLELKRMASYSLTNYVSSFSLGLPLLALPTLILRELGAPAAAYFYIASMFAALLYAVPQSAAQSLFAEGVHDGENVKLLLGRALKFVSWFVLASVISIILLGHFMLHLFGRAYVSHGYILLVWLAAAAVPKIFSNLFSAVLRIQGKMAAIVFISSLGAVIQLVASYEILRRSAGLAMLGALSFAVELWAAAAYAAVLYLPLILKAKQKLRPLASEQY